jgi:hypothetical protein
MLKSNYVYFPPADLAIIRDHFLGSLVDEGGTPSQYTGLFKELTQILAQETDECIEEYREKLNELCRINPRGYYAWMYKVHSDLHDDHLEGLWIWDTNFIGILMRKLDDARRYFRNKKKSG